MYCRYNIIQLKNTAYQVQPISLRRWMYILHPIQIPKPWMPKYGRVISWKHWVPQYLRTAPSGGRRLIPVYRCLDFPIAYPAGAGPTFQGGFCPTTSMIGMHHGHCGAMAKNQRNKHTGPIRQLIDMILTSRSVPILKQDRMTNDQMIKKLKIMTPLCLHIIMVWKCPRSCSAYKLRQCQSWVFYMLMFCYLMAERDRTSIWYFLFWQFNNLTQKCHNIFH